MNILNRINGISRRSQYKVICLMLYLVIIMTKIMSYTCQDFAGTVTINGVSKQVFSLPINDLRPCAGKPNCFYQRNSKNCTKMTQLSINLKIPNVGLSIPPPLVATLTKVSKKNERGFLKGAFIAMDATKPLQLILCDKRIDMVEWAKISLAANTSLPPALNMFFSIVDPDPPVCVLADDFNHKVFWSDNNQRTIRAYDTKTNDSTVLASLSTVSGSMVIDPTLRLLFWCNVESIGSIERVNFDKSNRVDITKGKYDLHYPDTLGIDLVNRMLFWTADNVIHTSDYNGDNHKIVEKSESYDPNFPGCIRFADGVEHNFFWENHKLQHFNRSFAPNHLLLISCQKNDEKILNDTKLHKLLRKHRYIEFIDWYISHECPNPLPKGFQCLPVRLLINSSIYTLAWLNLIALKLTKQQILSRLIVEHEHLIIQIQWFYLNLKTQKVFYYVPIKNFYWLKFCVEHNIQHKFPAKHKKKNTQNTIYLIVQQTNIPSSDFIIYFENEKSVYLLNTTDNSTKIYNYNGTTPKQLSSPRIFSYITQVVDYNNNAQAHTIVMRKYVLITVFNLVLQSLM